MLKTQAHNHFKIQWPSSGRPVVRSQASPGMLPGGRTRFFFGSKTASVVIFGDFVLSQLVFFGFGCAVLFFSIFVLIWSAPGNPPDPKKPLKSLYCRRFSKFRQNQKSWLLGPLWSPSGVTFGAFLVAVGFPGALWAGPGRPKDAKVRKKSGKNRSQRLPGTPQRPQGCQFDPIRARSVPEWVPGWVPGCQNGLKISIFQFYLCRFARVFFLYS